MKDLECPNCGSANPISISEGQFKCSNCETVYVNAALIHQKTMKSAKVMGLSFLLVFASIMLLIFSFVAVVIWKTIIDPDKPQQEFGKDARENVVKTQPAADPADK